MSEFKYDIGDKAYIQKPLVLGQIRQMIECLKGTTIQSFRPLEIFNQLKDRMPMLLAIVLTGEGKSPRDKNLEEMAEEFEFSINIGTAIEVIEDFFDCNPTASVMEKLEGMQIKIMSQISGLSKKSSSSSQEEISPSETESSGDTLPKNASPSSDI